jgi:hypothetical protein
MDNFRDTAFYLMVWHTFLAVLGTLLFIVIEEIEPATALLVAADLALLFSLALVIRTKLLSDRAIVRGVFWRTVPAKLRPPGEAGLRMARAALEETWLRFAKGAAAAAIVLSALAYASHDLSIAAPAPSIDSGSALLSTYRSGGLLPTY